MGDKHHSQIVSPFFCCWLKAGWICCWMRLKHIKKQIDTNCNCRADIAIGSELVFTGEKDSFAVNMPKTELQLR